jgi:uncharacterized Zn-binding protein involved in type VI secretion
MASETFSPRLAASIDAQIENGNEGLRMRTLILTGLVAGALIAAANMATAQSPSPSPGVITGGADNVMVNGKPAARVGDTTSEGSIIEGVPNVFINGKPATVIGNRTGCGGIVAGGATGVFINGKPMARQGDQTSGCAK